MDPVLIVVILRVFSALIILRFPFWGVVINMIVDTLDYTTFRLLGGVNWINYNSYDKALDTWYLLVAMYKSKDFDLIPRRISYALMSWRLLGVIIFEFVKFRWLLFVFPNLFEFWFLFWAARNKWFKKLQFSWKMFAIVIVIILSLKLYHEYILHVSLICENNGYFCGLDKYLTFLSPVTKNFS